MENNIRVQRAIKKISQDELAIALGMSRQAIHAIETKKYIPSALAALRIAHYFGKTMEEVFSLEEEEKKFAAPLS